MNWMALAPVPMTATRLPRRSTPWSHVAEWNAGPANFSEPGDVGIARPRQLTDGRDQHVDHDGLTVADLDGPFARRLVERGSGHLGAEPDVAAHVVLVGDVMDVIEDGRLPGEAMRPARVGLEGVGVERRRHIARRARIGVLPPDAADVVGLLEDDDVVVPALLQLDGGGKAAEPRSDDGDRRLHVLTLATSATGLLHLYWQRSGQRDVGLICRTSVHANERIG